MKMEFKAHEQNNTKDLLKSMVKNFDPNVPQLSDAWRAWLKNFELSAAAARIETDSQKKAWMLLLGGKELQNIYDYLMNRHKQPDEKSENFNTCKERISLYFLERQHIDKFRQVAQAENENFENFTLRLRRYSQNCGFKNPEDDIKRQIAIAAYNLNVRRKASIESNFTIKQLEHYAQKYEQMKNKRLNTPPKVVTPQRKPVKPPHRINRRTFCVKCGSVAHIQNVKTRCRAFGKICGYCGMRDHLISCCMHKILEERHDATTAQNAI